MTPAAAPTKTDDHITIAGHSGVHRSDPVAGGTLCGYRKGVTKRTEDAVTCIYCRELKPMKSAPAPARPDPPAKPKLKRIK